MQKKHTTMSYKKAFCALTRWCTGIIMGGFLVFGASEASAQVVVEGNVFGGGNAADVSGNTTVLMQGTNPTVNTAVYGGGAKADVGTNASNTTTVTIEGGHVLGNVYGGGLGNADTAALVQGVVTVNIGRDNGGSVSGEATIDGAVFGCNNVNGTPKADVFVNIYKTAHTSGNYVADNGFALNQVFGGGNQAAYLPVANKKTTVHIYTCDNTIEYVYGGGNAADVGNSTTNSATHVIIDGGRIEWLFGGGNGYSATGNHNNPAAPNYNPGANIYGTTTVDYHAGEITYIFGGSNQFGNVSGAKAVNILADGACATKHIVSLYGGSNEAPTTGNVELTLGCSANTCTIDTVFGGSRNADITGNVTLNIEGGSFSNVFGGNNKGGAIGGTVTLNLMGGTIGNAFGGNNKGGTIAGKLSVNMLDKGSCPLTVANIYGGGNLAAYTPTTPGAYPEVNLMHGHVTGNVYGGGLGTTATVTSTPTVNVGYQTSMAALASSLKGSALTTATVTVDGNVYGGGDAAAVNGSTTVTLQQVTGGGVTATTTVSNNVFGGGNLADVSGNTDVAVNGGTVTHDVYGGGALADVGTNGSNHTNVTIAGGTISDGVYGGGLGDDTHEALVKGAVQVTVNSGSVNDVFGCNNVNGRPTSTVRVDINNNVGGNVYGGGNLATYSGDPYVYINKGTVTGHVFGGGNGDPDDETQTLGSVTGNPHVIVGDMTVGHDSYQAIVNGDVYGGGNAAKVVTGTPTVSVPAKCNTQITNVYGGGNAADVPATSVTIDGGTISGSVFGGGHGNKDATPDPIAANVTGNTNVTVTGGTINQVFGGSNSNGTIGGTINVNIDKDANSCDMVINEVYGGGNYAASNAGNITIGCTGDDPTEYIDYVYGGANRANITGDIELKITGGRINHAFGGNNNSGVISGDITVNVEWTTPACSDQYLGDVYGGGNLAPHTGNPAVNIKNGTATNVFGGGKGATAVVNGNPVVTIGDANASHLAVVSGNVYGGGDAAAVTGNTTVTYNDKNASSTVANLFGGGNAAGISGTTTVTLTSGKVTTGLYGGCNTEGTVGGDITVALNGGTVGVSGSTTDVVYGGGFGHSTATGGDIAVNLNGTTVYGNLYGGSALGSVNGSSSNTTTVTIGSNGLHGTVFGGGMGSGSGAATQATTLGNVIVNYNTANAALTGIYGGANVNGNVTGDIAVNIEATVGATGAGNSRDVFGGGLGQYTSTDGNITVTVGNSTTPTIYGDLYGGSKQGEVGATGKTAKVDFKAGTLNGSIYGGGMGQNGPDIAATVSGGTEVAISGGTITTGVYGGCNARGEVEGTINVNVTGGTIGANGAPVSVYGGGYGHNTSTDSSVTVTINGASAVVWGDVYGGSSLGDVNNGATDTTTVNILDGTVKGDVFGGGLGVKNGDAATEYGVVIVNIGSDNGDGTYNGNATILGDIFGCNNANGSPQDTVMVNIYRTAHSATDSAKFIGAAPLSPTYAIDEVFGGGKEANYSGSKQPAVNIFSCDNTVRRVFGGGDAAAVTGTKVAINGGRFDYVFGGGNGEVTPANVGTGGIDLTIHGGTIGTLVNGSNTSGTIGGDIVVHVDNNSPCSEDVGDFFGGSNMVDIGTNENPVDVITTIDCGAGTFRNVYGGSNAANIIGNVVLNIKGGTMDTVFGGSKGLAGTPANITGNVTLNLYGGTVSQDAFGGSNVNGNITGNITVNVLDHEGTCALDVNNIYGGGNLTPYTPTNASATTPTINVMHIKQSDGIRGNVYGGGKGATAIVTANPRVNIGYNNSTMNALADVEYPAGIDRNSQYVAKVAGSVFGGGDAAAVTGSPIVTMDRFNSEVANLYGGGNEAGISGNTQVVINEGRLSDGIYGGCNTSGTVTGNATVDILGGTIGAVDDNARIFGGGFGQTTEVAGNVHVTLGNQAGTAEPTLYGDMYGGSALGNVNTNSTHFDSHHMNTVETTTIDILSGTVVGNVFGGGLGQKNGVNGATSDIAPNVYGKIQVNVGYKQADNNLGNAVLRNATIHGCNNLNGTPQHDVYIDVYGTHREASDEVGATPGTFAIASIYGGGNRADYNPEYIYRKDQAFIDAIHDTDPSSNDSLSRPYVKKPHVYIHGCYNTVGKLYGGGNAAAVTGDSLVFDGGRFNEVFGGGNGVLIPANVGIGGVFLEGKGGSCGFIYEHCNRSGSISGATTFINGGEPGDCNNGVLTVKNHFCGGNEVDIYGEFKYLFVCSETPSQFERLYGGCRLGSTYGNITLVIEGGNYGTIFGGPQGDADFAANVRKFPTLEQVTADQEKTPEQREYKQAMVDWLAAHSTWYGKGGNVTIVLKGGTIGDVYGGCDANGNVEGRITIIVDSSILDCPLQVDNIYGGGNLAVYNPDTAATNPNYQFPLVDLRNGHVNNNVFGGGKGSLASVANGLVTSNPKVWMHPDVAGGKHFTVWGNVYGGGELGQVNGNTLVQIDSGTVKGSAYGGGLGNTANEGFGLVAKNAWVNMLNGHVERSIYGGGEMGSVGTFTAYYSAGENDLHVAGEPKTCQTGTGVAKVTIGGNSMVGVLDKAIMPPPDPEEDDYGYIFCGSRGIADSVHYTTACKLAVVDSAYLEIGGDAIVTSSAYGGCENGQVLRNTYVKITGTCQIGVGYNPATSTHDAKYTEAQWSSRNPAYFHEVSHWPYAAPYAIYDAFANTPGYNSQGGSHDNASNGHTFYGNVYGGGSGYYAIDPGTGVAAGTWRQSAGRVNGNTHVVVDGGHILNNIYGGNEMTDVLGNCTVDMSGGTLGVPRTVEDILSRPLSGYLFGAGKGDPRVLFNKMTDVQNTTVNVTGTARIFGSIFGGGEDGHVLGDVEVNIDLGSDTLGTTGTSYVDGNVFGGGRGFDGLALTAGNVGGNITVNILSGNLLGSVYGGGRLASVGPDLCDPNEACYGEMPDDPNRGIITVNITGGTIGNDVASDYSLDHPRGGNVFGGSMGRLTKLDGTYILPLWYKLGAAKETHVNISGTSTVVKGNVYGGSELGTVTGNTYINIYDHVTIGVNGRNHGNVYGGGYGHPELTPAQRSQVNDDDVSDDVPVFAGRTYGNTNVNIYGDAEVFGTVYGGGEMASVGNENYYDTTGNTLVNIGELTGVLDGNGCAANNAVAGNALIHGEVYGANNISGTPFGNANVNIYSTARTAKQQASYQEADREYALSNVYGGGNLADYVAGRAGCRATVHVYTCLNTIEHVYGGGNAAAAYGGGVTIDGGRFDQVFGGGNGQVTAANIGPSGTLTTINAGYIRQLFGGSNMQGSISGPVNTTLTHIGSCEENIGEFYAGSNEAPIVGDINTTIACGTQTLNVDRIYGGCNLTDVYGSVTLNVEGGVFDYVFGGSRGTDIKPANIKAYDDGHLPAGKTVGQGGDVTLNISGGTITNAFGGSDYNGNIEGVITVNVLDAENANCPLVLTNLYGGSNLATYTPTTTAATGSNHSPVVNIEHIASKTVLGNTVDGILGNVFGGGKGAASTTYGGDVNLRENADKGKCTSNPQVNIGDNEGSHYARIVGTTIRNYNDTRDSLPPTSGNVYGGGEMADVIGSTEVTMKNTNSLVAGNIFGAGQGIVGDSLSANVSVNSAVTISGGTVKKNVYGGGELASVGAFQTVASGHDMIDGTATVTITGGHIGADDADHATEQYANGNVYGGGLGKVGTQTANGHIFHFSYYNYVNNTDVTVGGTAIVRGSVFGGAEDGHVWRNTSVKITGGEIGTELTSAEEAEDHDGDGVTIYTGNVYGGGRGIDEIDAQHHHSLTAGRVFGNTYVCVSGGIIHHSVFGGGSLASVGDTIHDIDGGVHDIMGNTISGQYTFDTLGGSITRAYRVGDPTTGTGTAHVRITGGRIGLTGHNEGNVFGSGRGMAGEGTNDESYHMAFVHNTKVYIKDTTIDEVLRVPDIRGSVFGGGANGHVTQNSYVNMSAGVVGGKDAATYTAMGIAGELPAAVDTTLCGIDYYSGISALDTITDHWGRSTRNPVFLGNVYAGGRGVDHSATSHTLSRYAGRVFGNAKVEVSGGVVYHSVFGGGSLASVGTYTADGSGYFTDCDPGTGKTVVVVSGGRIGNNGRNNGRVFGASRGMAGSDYNHLSFVNNTDVTICGTARVRGSVFGGGEDGHVLDSTLVKIEGGVIGSGNRHGDNAWQNTFIGNVYGGGRGVDVNLTSHNPSATAGWVRGATHVLVSGGHIQHNVYGGGSIASVGPRGTVDVGYNDEYALNDRTGRAWVEVTGGLIGICIDSTDRNSNYYGNVYGAGRGRAGVGIRYGNDWDRYTYVHNAKVIINYSNTALANVAAETAYGKQHITGNVFGGGNNGHVNNSTSVTITRGRIGSHGAMGYGSLEGNVFGGGNGEEPFEAYLVRDGYYITNAQLASGTGNSGIAYNRTDRSAVNTYYETSRTHDDSLAVVDSLSVLAGLVYGDANVLINAATAGDVQIKHHVYGGGSMASVGDYWTYPATVGTGIDETETLGEVYPLTANKRKDCPTDHSGSNTATGICTVTITGGTFGTNGINNGMIFGGCRGLEGNLMDITNRMAYFNDAHVTLGTTSTLIDYNDPQILVNGSVYGGGENGHGVGSTSVTIHDGKIGNRGSMYDRIKDLDDKNEDGSITADEKREMDSLLVIASNCGNVYGGGCGTDKYHERDTVVTRVIGGVLTTLKSTVDPSQDSVESVYRYNPYCGVVYGNTNVVIDGGYVEHNVYGGGSMANVGRWVGQVNPMVTHTDPSNSFAISWPVEVTVRRGTGHANVTISDKARIGYSGSDNGDVFGAARGEAGDRYEVARYANVHSTTVTVDIDMPAGYDYTKTEKQIKNTVIKQYSPVAPLVAGSVYGGSENGQVTKNTSLTLTNGVVGHSLYGGGKGKGTYTTHNLRYKVADGVHAVGDDSSATIYSVVAGKVYGNTEVTMAGGHVVRNIFGGGNLGSVGKGNYAGGVGDYREAGYGERWPDDNRDMRDSLVTTGHTVVTVNGGYVGALGSTKDGLPTGNIFGGCRGEAAPFDRTNPRFLYSPAYFLGYVNHTTVTIGASGTPQIYGSVYGGGQDGHVRGNTVVTINDGTIGCQYNAANIALQGNVTDKEDVLWKLRGNVFGAGSGLGQYTDRSGNLQYNASSGSVIDSTFVLIAGGQVARNVYGGGSFATVGPPKVPPIVDDPTYIQSHARVRVTGSTIGYIPTDLDDTATFYGGDVYGAGRGLSSDTYKDYCEVPHTDVYIASTVNGNVYGGGEDGHVIGNTNVVIASGATVGFGGTAYLQGSVFGGGKGSGNAIDHDSDPGTDDEFRIHKTCGRVGGNTTVTMDNGMIHGSIFGGGRLALTGVDVDGSPSFREEAPNDTKYDSINHGFATVTVNGGTIGTTDPADLLACDWSAGDIMGSGKGDIENYEDVLAGRVANTKVTISGNTTVRGSVFGGGEMAGVGYWTEAAGHPFVAHTGNTAVTISGNTEIGLDYEYTVDPDDNPGDWTIYNSTKDTLIHTITGNVVGGSQGDVDPESPHWVSMGRSLNAVVTIGASTYVKGNVFGGSEQGILMGNTHVTINGGTFGYTGALHSQLAKAYTGDIYAAGYGCDHPTMWNSAEANDSTGNRADGLLTTPIALAGRTYGDARVDIIGGTVHGSVYGGGSYASVGYEKSSAHGNTLVNIGEEGPTGAGATINGEVFGANNFMGTPYGNTAVHIYRTAHTVANTCPTNAYTKTLADPTDALTIEDVVELPEADANFALQAVYGGGNRAAHTPFDVADGTTLVYVHYCEENTIKTIYGGGNAANTNNNHIIVEGGRIYEVFGGGNGFGANNPGADVSGTAHTEIRGGLITDLFGGSNAKGDVPNIDLEVNKVGTCDLMVAHTYGGGNEAFGGGGGVVTIGCGTHIGTFYAGSRNADLGSELSPVDIVLNIKGGIYDTVFGGSRGTDNNPADIYGSVTVNVFGGNIGKLFGGSDINGNIKGKITVNVDLDPNYDCEDGLGLDTIFGAGNMAVYRPALVAGAKIASPEINIINDSCANGKTFGLSTIFGAGYGDGNLHVDQVNNNGCLSGQVDANPVVNVGGIDSRWDKNVGPMGSLVADNYRRNIAIVHGNIYGGGQSAPVNGNPTVTLYSSRTTGLDGSSNPIKAQMNHDTTHVKGSIFGAGSGAKAVVDGSTTVGIFGDATVVDGNVYGGGEQAILTGSTDVQVGYERHYVTTRPVISVAANNTVDIHVSTAGSTIYYTTDGSVPTEYTGPFSANAGQTIRAIAVKEGFDTSQTSNAIVVHLPAPTIAIDGSGTATITNTTAHGQSDGVSLFYTLDGSLPAFNTDRTPADGTLLYNPSSKPTVPAGKTIKAMAVKTGFTNSSVTSMTR